MLYQITLPETTYKKIAELAAKRGQTPDELLIEVARDYLAETDNEDELPPYNPDDDPLAEFAGAFHLDVTDLGINHDKYLAEAYGDNHIEERSYQSLLGALQQFGPAPADVDINEARRAMGEISRHGESAGG